MYDFLIASKLYVFIYNLDCPQGLKSQIKKHKNKIIASSFTDNRPSYIKVEKHKTIESFDKI